MPNPDKIELVQLNPAVTVAHVESLMPPDWRSQIANVISDYGRFVEFKGGFSTSMENKDFVTTYTLVRGPDIERNLPWLWELYHGGFRRLVSRVADEEQAVDPQPEYGANINTIDIKTQRKGYELHRDINPYTGMLGVTTVPEEVDGKKVGGELVHVILNDQEQEIGRIYTRIQSGWFYIFRGDIYPHKVKPLEQIDFRITAPFDYGPIGWDSHRPDDMKAILEGEKSHLNIKYEDGVWKRG